LGLPGRESSATHDLVFRASELPQGGLKSYFVQRTAISHKKVPKWMPKGRGSNRADSIISNGVRSIKNTSSFSPVNRIFLQNVTVTVDGPTGLIRTVVVDGKEYALKQDFLWYEGWNGNNNGADNRASGAYIFRPTTEQPKTISSLATISSVYTGN
jgi:lysosomal alpha-mannosidase